MQLDIQDLLDGLQAPAIFYREYTVRYFNKPALVLFPALRAGEPLPEECHAADSPFRAEATETAKGTLYLFRPKLEERSAEDLEAIIRQLRSTLSVLFVTEDRISQLFDRFVQPQAKPLLDQFSRSLFVLRRLCEHVDLLRNLEGRKPYAYREGTVDIAELVQLLAEPVGDLARQVGLKLRLDCKPVTLVTAGDGALLERMLLNLISNAIKATPRGGEIGLKLEQTEGRALLSVWDSGSGMEPEQLTRVFRTQRQAGPAQRGDGTGLGLRLVREVAVLHGGIILAEARRGGGNKITVSLPLRSGRGGALHSTTTWEQDLLTTALVELADTLPDQVFTQLDLDG